MFRTRIKIIKSEVKTLYIPQYHFFLWIWKDFSPNGNAFLRASSNQAKYTQEWAESVIKYYLLEVQKRSDEELEAMTHKKTSTTEYIDYP